MRFVDEHLRSCPPTCPGDGLCPKTEAAQQAAFERARYNVEMMRAVLSEFVDVAKLSVSGDELTRWIYRLYQAARYKANPSAEVAEAYETMQSVVDKYRL